MAVQARQFDGSGQNRGEKVVNGIMDKWKGGEKREVKNITTVSCMGLVAFALIVLLCGIFESGGLSWNAYLLISLLEIVALLFLSHRLDKLQREQWEQERQQKRRKGA